MAAAIKGTGLIWSTDGVTFTAGIISATTTGALQSVDFERRSEMAKVRGAGGATVARVFYDTEHILNISVVPTGSSIANAKTSADAWIPAPGTQVTVADADTTVVDASQGAKYTVVSSKLRRTVDGNGVCDLTLEQTVDNDTTTAVS